MCIGGVPDIFRYLGQNIGYFQKVCAVPISHDAIVHVRRLGLDNILFRSRPLEEIATRYFGAQVSSWQLEELARDAESEAQARRILAAQASRDERLAIADDVIVNDQGLEHLDAEVSRLHELYIELAASS